jgi:hypothetical protein
MGRSEIRTLGELSICVNDQPVTWLASRKAVVLPAYIAGAGRYHRRC